MGDRGPDHRGKLFVHGASAIPSQVKARREHAYKKLAELAHQTILSSFRATVECPFRVIICPFGFAKAGYKGWAKDGYWLAVLFWLGNRPQVESV